MDNFEDRTMEDPAEKPLQVSSTGVNANSTEHRRLARRWEHAVALLADCVEINQARRGGIPCLKGTGITLAQVLAQFAEGDSVDDFVEDMEIDRDALVSFLTALSIILDRPARP